MAMFISTFALWGGGGIAQSGDRQETTVAATLKS